MTGGVRVQLETGLSQSGERLQPPWLPHAMEGGVAEEDGGEVCDMPITCDSSVSSSYVLHTVVAEWCTSFLCQRFSPLPTCDISVPSCVVGMSLYLPIEN